MMLKPPRPGSLGEITSRPPPASCSPLSGKSSSNTITESFPVGSGVGSVNTVTGAKLNAVVVGVHAFAVVVLRMLQAGGIDAPLWVCPQPVFTAPREPGPCAQLL